MGGKKTERNRLCDCLVLGKEIDRYLFLHFPIDNLLFVEHAQTKKKEKETPSKDHDD